MRKKNQAIPVNTFGDEAFAIERFAFSDLPELGEWEQPERHDRHSFFLIEQGSVTLEIDFERFEIAAPSIVYMHPDQVHRILGFQEVQAIAWALTDEQLQPDYLRQLENIAPAAPALLSETDHSLLTDLAATALKLNGSPALQPALKDSLQALVYVAMLQYAAAGQPADRFEATTRAFKKELEQHFVAFKRPADYAEKLNLSTAYLNECIKTATGFSVTHHIHQRVILEAKRLLAHSGLSVKEIAATLGYDDYPYFCRLFSKVAGTTPSQFKNRV